MERSNYKDERRREGNSNKIEAVRKKKRIGIMEGEEREQEWK